MWFLLDDVIKNPFQPQYHFCFSGWTSRTVVLHLAEKQQKTVVCICTCQPFRGRGDYPETKPNYNSLAKRKPNYNRLKP